MNIDFNKPTKNINPFILPPHLNTSPLNEETITQKKLWLAPNATVIGDVRFGTDVSIWYNSVARGDVNYIVIGDRSNLQDGVIIHVTNNNACIISEDVTIGHGAIIHAATIEKHTLIGMRATVLTGAIIGHGSIIAAGAVVREKEEVEPFSLMAGVPAKKIRTLNESVANDNLAWAKKYVLLKDQYLNEILKK